MSEPRPGRACRIVLGALAGSDVQGGVSGRLLCERTGVGPAGIYPSLVRLEADGWVVGLWETPQPHGQARQRLYRLTEAGRRAADAAEAGGVAGFSARLSKAALRAGTLWSAVRNLSSRPAVLLAAATCGTACTAAQVSYSRLSPGAALMLLGALPPVIMPVLMSATQARRGAAGPRGPQRGRSGVRPLTPVVDALKTGETWVAQLATCAAARLAGAGRADLAESWLADLPGSVEHLAPLTHTVRHAAGYLPAALRIRVARLRSRSLDRGLDLLVRPRQRAGAGAGIGALAYPPIAAFQHQGLVGAAGVTAGVAALAVILCTLARAARAMTRP